VTGKASSNNAPRRQEGGVPPGETVGHEKCDTAARPPPGVSRRFLVYWGPVGVAACTHTAGMPPAPPAPPIEISRPAVPPPYRVQVGDILAIRLMLNPELNEEVTVRPDGRISTTLVHDELAYGRTVPELDRSLERGYLKQLKEPRLSVVVKSFAPTRIYVGGEVNNPGEFVNVGPALTVSQALARAGGSKLSGDNDAVFIIRRGPGDVPEFLSTRYGKIIHAKDPDGDVRLAPYDVVYVPKTGIAEVYGFFNQYVQQFVPVSWGFSYSLGPSSVVH
jgi:polysaccharide export outer membrane protein